MKIVTKLRFIGVALLVGVFVSAPFALVAEEEKKPSRRERLMQRFDKNKDGKLDEAERESIRKLLSRSRGSEDENAAKRDDKIHIPKDTIRRRSTHSSWHCMATLAAVVASCASSLWKSWPRNTILSTAPRMELIAVGTPLMPATIGREKWTIPSISEA